EHTKPGCTSGCSNRTPPRRRSTTRSAADVSAMECRSRRAGARRPRSGTHGPIRPRSSAPQEALPPSDGPQPRRLPILRSAHIADTGGPMVLAIITVVLCVLGFPIAVTMAYLIEPKADTGSLPPSDRPAERVPLDGRDVEPRQT